MGREIKFLILGTLIGALLFGCCLPSPVSEKPKVSLNLNRLSVKVQVYAPELNSSLMASGFAVDNKHIITAGHFCTEVESAIDSGIVLDTINILFVNNNEELGVIADLKIVKVGEDIDLCLLEKDRHGIVPVILHDDPKYKIGEKVTAIGAPLGWFPVETSGKVVGVENENEFVTSSPSARGNSGCPVFDEQGNVIGMIVKVSQFYSHLSIGVKSTTIRRFLEDE